MTTAAACETFTVIDADDEVLVVEAPDLEEADKASGLNGIVVIQGILKDVGAVQIDQRSPEAVRVNASKDLVVGRVYTLYAADSWMIENLVYQGVDENNSWFHFTKGNINVWAVTYTDLIFVFVL